MLDKSAVRSRNYITQIRDFGGLWFGNIAPTDIDGLIEYKNICYVFIETKYSGTEVPLGQRLALERLCDDMTRVKPTISIIASHNSHEDIDVKNTIVTEYRFRNKWHKEESTITTYNFINRFINWVEGR